VLPSAYTPGSALVPDTTSKDIERPCLMAYTPGETASKQEA
jgi:hypothetical protein